MWFLIKHLVSLLIKQKKKKRKRKEKMKRRKKKKENDQRKGRKNKQTYIDMRNLIYYS